MVDGEGEGSIECGSTRSAGVLYDSCDSVFSGCVRADVLLRPLYPGTSSDTASSRVRFVGEIIKAEDEIAFDKHSSSVR